MLEQLMTNDTVHATLAEVLTSKLQAHGGIAVSDPNCPGGGGGGGDTGQCHSFGRQLFGTVVTAASPPPSSIQPALVPPTPSGPSTTAAVVMGCGAAASSGGVTESASSGRILSLEEILRDCANAPQAQGGDTAQIFKSMLEPSADGFHAPPSPLQPMTAATVASAPSPLVDAAATTKIRNTTNRRKSLVTDEVATQLPRRRQQQQQQQQEQEQEQP